MIVYMPFTYISDGLIRSLVATVGPFTLGQLVETLVPSHIQARTTPNPISILFPRTLDGERLVAVINAFRQWGELHEGRLAAMAGLYRSELQKADYSDDTTATQIRTLIRQYDNSPANQPPDSFFQAALFLAMAQLHDEQQDGLVASLSSVNQMEIEMATQLNGPTDSGSVGSEEMPIQRSFDLHGEDPGLDFAEQRLACWAHMATRLDAPGHLYLTTSSAVYDQLLEQLPEAVYAGQWSLPWDPHTLSNAAPGTSHPLQTVIDASASAEDPQKALESLGNLYQEDDTPADITLHIVPGCRPYDVLSRLARKTIPDPWPTSEIRHTVLGRLNLPLIDNNRP